MLVPLITAPYLARVLGASATGQYSYVHSVTSIIVTLCLLGVFNYGNRQIAYYRDDKKQINNIFWSIIGTRLILLIICTIVYFVCALLINKYILSFTIYYTYVIAYFLDCTWLYVGVEDMKWAVIKNTITKLIAIIGIFIFVKNENDVNIYVLIQGLSLLTSNLLAYTQIKKYVNIKIPIFKFSKQIIYESLLLFLPTIATTIYLQSDKIMIELITGMTSQVSFYDYSEKIITIPLTFITVLGTVIMPRLANDFKKNNKSSINKIIYSSLSFSIFLAVPMIFGLILLAPKFIPWYLGEEFKDTIYAITIISPIILSNTFTSVSNQYFTATNQIKIMIKSQFFSVLLNVIVNAILIPKFQFYGAAIATILTSYLCAIIQFIYLHKQVNLKRIFSICTKYLVLAIIMFCISFIVTKNLNSNYITTIIQIILSVILYLVLCTITKDNNIKLLYNKLFGLFTQHNN